MGFGRIKDVFIYPERGKHTSLGQRPRNTIQPYLSPIGAQHGKRVCYALTGLELFFYDTQGVALGWNAKPFQGKRKVILTPLMGRNLSVFLSKPLARKGQYMSSRRCNLRNSTNKIPTLKGLHSSYSTTPSGLMFYLSYTAGCTCGYSHSTPFGVLLRSDLTFEIGYSLLIIGYSTLNSVPLPPPIPLGGRHD